MGYTNANTQLNPELMRFVKTKGGLIVFMKLITQQ